MKVFLDTNIVVDYLSEREPFATNAKAIFQLATDGDIHVYVSDLTFVNVVYILRKYMHSTEKIYDAIRVLRNMVEIVSTGMEAIDYALNIHITDFEDAVQYFSATRYEADCIVSRNQKDFPVGNIPVITPSLLLSKFYM